MILLLGGGALVFGLLIGSFLNVCIHRIPRGLSIVFPGSFCPSCHLKIAGFDNVPILSYLLLRGRCRNCSRPISPRYPVVELMMGMLSYGLFDRLGVSWDYPVHLAFAACLVAVAFIDLDFQIIPDRISLGGAVAFFLASSFLFPEIGWKSAAIGIAMGGGILYLVAVGYYKIAHREGMGGGDIKLLAMIGAFFGWRGVLPTLLVGALLGSVVGAALLLLKKADRTTAIPFGPFLSIGGLSYLFFSDLFDFMLLEWPAR